MKQKILGQFFTNKNVFKGKPFLDWFNAINTENKMILEPFAGKNGLIHMLEDLNLITSFSSCLYITCTGISIIPDD